MESILTSIKLLVGVMEGCDSFDETIIAHINTVFDDLNDLGVGPSEGFYIEDETAIWTDFMPKTGKFESVKTYMQLRVQLLFDPPTNASLLASMERQIEKLEWRLNVKAETTDTGTANPSTPIKTDKITLTDVETRKQYDLKVVNEKLTMEEVVE